MKNIQDILNLKRSLAAKNQFSQSRNEVSGHALSIESMNIKDLKKLAEKVGSVLVMNGDEPSFVLLSYKNYKKISGSNLDGYSDMDDEDELGDESPVPFALTGDSEDSEEPYVDEEKISRLNEEIALLKNEIRQREEDV